MKVRRSILVVAASLVACAAVPDRIELPAQTQILKYRIDFRDARTIDQIAGRRSDLEQSDTAYYGDEAFSGSPVTLLRNRLEAALGERLAQRPVVLRRFDVYAGSFKRQIPSHAGNYGLLGLLIAHGVENARADRRLWSKIAVEVDGTTIEALSSKEASVGEFSDGATRVVLESIDAIITNIRQHLDGPPAGAVQAPAAATQK